MGCGDSCPIYPGNRHQDWDLHDPADEGLEEVRAIRDEIDRTRAASCSPRSHRRWVPLAS